MSHYRTAGLRLDLTPLPVAGAPKSQPAGSSPPTDDELLFGESESALRRQGLI